MLNGGFKNKCSDEKDINKFLKEFELEIRNIQKNFMKSIIDLMIKQYLTYKEKSLSKILLELENKILQVMIGFFKI